jgi:hypothetical protein
MAVLIVAAELVAIVLPERQGVGALATNPDLP